MVRLRDRLYRFRPAGAPGAAGAVGVPARVDPQDELAPVFARLADTEAACDERLRRGEQEAATLVERSRTAAAARRDGVRRRAESERLAAAEQARARVAAEVDALTAEAAAKVAEVQLRAAAGQGRLVAAVVAAAESLLAGSEPL